MLALAAAGPNSAAMSVPALPIARHELPASLGPRVSALGLGPLPPDLYALLSGAAGPGGGSIPGTADGPRRIAVITGVYIYCHQGWGWEVLW